MKTRLFILFSLIVVTATLIASGVVPTAVQVRLTATTIVDSHDKTETEQDLLAITFAGQTASERSLASLYEQKLNEYAEATARYFTSRQANNTEAGFPHVFFGTGKFQVYKNGDWQEEAWDLTRGYGSYVNVNEVTLRFLSLAVAYKMNWLSYLPANDRYSESWGQILTGLQTLRTMQTSGNTYQFYNGHFHRTYLTTIARDGIFDLDRHVHEIVCPTNENTQSSDDNALPFMNLLVLEGLAKDPSVDIPDQAEIVNLCNEIRNAIDLKSFVVSNEIVHNYENGVPSTQVWDRLSAEGPIILAAMLLSHQITVDEFYQIAPSLEIYPVGWNTLDGSVIQIGKPSYHSAMFIHGLRAIHGMPVTDDEHPGLNYFETSTRPVFKAQLDYAGHHGYKALGSQVMSQALYGTPPFEMNGKQVQFPGNEDNAMPIPGQSLSRGTGPHAWFVPLARWNNLQSGDITTLFDWMAEYETAFFHSGSDTQLGWEATIPWTPDDTTYAWQASDSTWGYTDWGRPYETLNAAYIVLSIFDALNPNAPLASYNVEADRLKHIAAYFDNGTPLPHSPLDIVINEIAWTSTNTATPTSTPTETPTATPTNTPTVTCWAEDRSYCTTCAEEDNVNVPIFCDQQVSRFRVVATHPMYEVGVGDCEADFSGCPSPTPGPTAPDDVCTNICDDHTANVVQVCNVSGWWRPYSMTVTAPDRAASAHYLVLYRNTEGTNEWPGFFALYEDGNMMRLIPHPPVGRSEVCYGSSVIIGPAAPATRPYVDIQEVRVTPMPLSLDIVYRDGRTAHFDISVDRSQALVEVQVNYNSANPFVTFRSMWVSDGNCDVDHVQDSDGDFSILDSWTSLSGPWWFFHRRLWSEHNTCAPDIRIEVLEF